jgi:hypothetical protein
MIHDSMLAGIGISSNSMALAADIESGCRGPGMGAMIAPYRTGRDIDVGRR